MKSQISGPEGTLLKRPFWRVMIKPRRALRSRWIRPGHPALCAMRLLLPTQCFPVSSSPSWLFLESHCTFAFLCLQCSGHSNVVSLKCHLLRKATTAQAPPRTRSACLILLITYITKHLLACPLFTFPHSRCKSHFHKFCLLFFNI